MRRSWSRPAAGHSDQHDGAGQQKAEYSMCLHNGLASFPKQGPDSFMVGSMKHDPDSTNGTIASHMGAYVLRLRHTGPLYKPFLSSVPGLSKSGPTDVGRYGPALFGRSERYTRPFADISSIPQSQGSRMVGIPHPCLVLF